MIQPERSPLERWTGTTKDTVPFLSWQSSDDVKLEMGLSATVSASARLGVVGSANETTTSPLEFTKTQSSIWALTAW
jgi:hypothetical protein